MLALPKWADKCYHGCLLVPTESHHVGIAKEKQKKTGLYLQNARYMFIYNKSCIYMIGRVDSILDLLIFPSSWRKTRTVLAKYVLN